MWNILTNPEIHEGQPECASTIKKMARALATEKEVSFIVFQRFFYKNGVSNLNRCP